MQSTNLIMRFVATMEYFSIKGIPLVPRIIQWFIRVIFSADIPYTLRFGKGVILKHNGLGVVIHENAKIGRNVIIMQNVTIGGRNGRGAPIINEHVFIGAGACVLGDISIGKHAMIGANAVVIMDIPDFAVVGGVPARVLKYTDGKEENIN